MLNVKVLVIDDETGVRNALMRTFADEGYMILTASNGEQALELLARNTIDVVIADEKTPGITGGRLMRIIREICPNSLRIMLTGDDNLDSAAAALNEGEIFRYFLKPWDDGLLLAAVRLGLEQRGRLPAGKTAPAETAAPDRHQQLTELERRFPGISHVDRAEDGSILI